MQSMQSMVNPQVMPVTATTHQYYGAPMPGMPPPPPSYDQAMSHPIAPPNYISNQMPMQVCKLYLENIKKLAFIEVI